MKIVFMGTPAAATVTLQKLIDDGHEIVAVYTQPDRPSGRGNRITFSPVKVLAIEHGLQIHQPLKIKTPETLEEFKSHSADVAVVVAYGRILPEGFLHAFPMGAINVHFSLLPAYRGAAPVNWAIVNGETVTGVTTMKMDAGLDTGDVLLQKETKIGATETAPELMDRLAAIGAELLSETLKDFNGIKPAAQDHSSATFAPIMTREDGRIDWTLTAKEISNRVRGFQPFPSSFTFLEGKKIGIWAANSVGSDWKSDSGSILEAKGDKLIVAAGDGTLLQIDEIQFEGKRRMPVRDALNGSVIAVGKRFE